MEMFIDEEFREATYRRIYDDLLYCIEQSKTVSEELEKKRFARLAILLSAVFVESLSNLLFDHYYPPATKLDCVDDKTNLPKPIRKLRAVYKKFCKAEMTLETDGIQDIFIVRNKVIAHPAGESITKCTSGGKASREDRNINYQKLQLPPTYSEFSTDHAKKVFKEMKTFIEEYCKMLVTCKSSDEDNDFIDKCCLMISQT